VSSAGRQIKSTFQNSKFKIPEIKIRVYQGCGGRRSKSLPTPAGFQCKLFNSHLRRRIRIHGMLGPRIGSATERVERGGDNDERVPKRVEDDEETLPSSSQAAEALAGSAINFRISVVTMTGAAITIDDAAAADTVLSVKERVFAANRKLFVRRQRLVYQPGPFGMDALADDETLGGAGVARDGTAKLDVLLADLTEVEVDALGRKVRHEYDS
jgi:hypothetical protein